jgi:hypothetical protein
MTTLRFIPRPVLLLAVLALPIIGGCAADSDGPSSTERDVTTPPATGNTAPAEEDTAPAKENAAPAKENTAPAKEKTISATNDDASAECRVEGFVPNLTPEQAEKALHDPAFWLKIARPEKYRVDGQERDADGAGQPVFASAELRDGRMDTKVVLAAGVTADMPFSLESSQTGRGIQFTARNAESVSVLLVEAISPGDYVIAVEAVPAKASDGTAGSNVTVSAKVTVQHAGIFGSQAPITVAVAESLFDQFSAGVATNP